RSLGPRWQPSSTEPCLRRIGGCVTSTRPAWSGSSSPSSPAGPTHREEKYLAIAYARSFPAYVALRQLDLYRQMIVEGAWWDFVDDVAANLVGRIHRAEPERMRPILWEWIDAADMWLRRAALLSQLRSKSDTAAIFRVGRCGPRRRRAAARRQRRRHRRTHLCRR